MNPSIMNLSNMNASIMSPSAQPITDDKDLASPSGLRLTDTHCHLDFPDFVEDVAGVVARAKAAGVQRMVTIATHVARAERYQALAESHDGVWFTIGTHPHNAADERDVTVEDLLSLARHPRCVAIGEGGLDYFYERSPREAQAQSFAVQIAAARLSGLPLIIHARAADDDMIATLEREYAAGPFGAVLHCFSSGPELARRALAMGMYLSFSGILTFKASEAIREIAKAAPIDKVLVETDAPYLAPIPHRGQRNEPGFTVHTASVLAGLHGKTLAEMAPILEVNTNRFFAKMAS